MKSHLLFATRGGESSMLGSTQRDRPSLIARMTVGLIVSLISTSAFGITPAIEIQTIDGWTLRPAVHGGRVVGVLAARDPATVPAHTFSTVWFSRSAGGKFSWEGWSGESFVAAGQAIALRIGELDALPHAEIRGVVLGQQDAAASFVPMKNGVAAGDPFESIMPLLSPLLQRSLWLTLPPGGQPRSPR